MQSIPLLRFYLLIKLFYVVGRNFNLNICGDIQNADLILHGRISKNYDFIVTQKGGRILFQSLFSVNFCEVPSRIKLHPEIAGSLFIKPLLPVLCGKVAEP